MKLFASTNRPRLPTTAARQYGGSLIEALIATVIIGIMGAGTLSVSARVSEVQATTNQEQIAKVQLSNLLRSGATLCVNGVAVNPKPIISVPGVAQADLTLTIDGCAQQNLTIAGTVIATGRSTVKLTLTKSGTVIAQVGR